ncbi:MAG: GH92 family glycosyl hydrolase [Clostridia bacterium]|nr:GH92 family glycosyl hydrolase [Clostridia bacterium]
MKYCDYVNIKQGSASRHRYSNGNTLPLIQRPFGMIAFAPQTSDGNIRWYYHPEDRSLEGFRLTHQPSPWIGDYGAFCFIPQNGKLGLSGEERWSGFRPENTVMKPFYLRYNLLRTKSVFEVTTSERCAIFRVTFKDEGDNYFCVHSVKDNCAFSYNEYENTLYAVTDNHEESEGKNFKEYLIIRFPDNSVDTGGISVGINERIDRAACVDGENSSIHIKLRNKETQVKVASSYISFEQAKLNLEHEIKSKDFDSLCSESEEIWEEYLSRVRIKTTDEKKLKTFYSCMYRAFLYPHRCSEINGNNVEIHYCPHDGIIREGIRFTDNGFWDTYRTVYPFFSLVAKEELKLMLRSFINEYKDSGWLPRWLSIGERGCMPSTLIDAVICDGAVKGFIDKEDLETALEGMIKHSVTDAPYDYFGRNGAESYCRLGYVPYDEQNESVNLTLDAAYGDWCISVIAGMLGKEDIKKEYLKRSLNYKNIFDKETGFMRARDSKGNFRPGFSPTGWGRDYTEGSAWQNSFAVPHDIEGLAELYGGKEKLAEKIDELFRTKPDYEIVGYNCEIHEITEMAAVDFGQCAISNQPSFHIPYIYSALGYTDKTAKRVKELCEFAFSNEDDGFPGDEDNGTMAIWYIFGLLGFYPFCPGKAEFVKGIKQVDEAVICGKTIDADKFSGNTIPYGELI